MRFRHCEGKGWSFFLGFYGGIEGGEGEALPFYRESGKFRDGIGGDGGREIIEYGIIKA